MKHDLTLRLEVSLHNLTWEEFNEISHTIHRCLLSKNFPDDKLSFDEINKFFHLTEREYVPTSVQYPTAVGDEDDNYHGETTFELKC